LLGVTDLRREVKRAYRKETMVNIGGVPFIVDRGGEALRQAHLPVDTT
jgi:hypothetical protein